MMPTLNDLDLTPEQRAQAETWIRELAFGKWQEAGNPSGEDMRFWCEAEQEWILFQYVPHRLPPEAAQADDPDLRQHDDGMTAGFSPAESGSPHLGSLT